MRIVLEVSEDNECTSYPWWVIIDPPMKRGEEESEQDYHEIAMSVVGPFFSREEAEETLARTRYNYSKRAVVYCKSGCYTTQYQAACKPKHWADKPILRDLFWFLTLPHSLKQYLKEVVNAYR